MHFDNNDPAVVEEEEDEEGTDNEESVPVEENIPPVGAPTNLMTKNVPTTCMAEDQLPGIATDFNWHNKEVIVGNQTTSILNSHLLVSKSLWARALEHSTVS